MENGMSLSDIAAVTRGANDENGWGSGWFLIVVLFLFMFGFGGIAAAGATAPVSAIGADHVVCPEAEALRRSAGESHRH